MKEVIGVCLGAWSVKIAHISEQNDEISVHNTKKIVHNGNSSYILCQYLEKYSSIPVIVTGRKFRNSVNLHSISETEATEYALEHIIPHYMDYADISAVATLGAETFLVYNLNKYGHIRNVASKNKCASGTGEFFLQQIKRMGLTIDEAMAISTNTVKPYKVSGRCSVFCKSDCTHALNKGVAKANVVAGLAKMIAEKINEILPSAADSNGKVLLVGGVTNNTLVMEYLQHINPNVIIPNEADYFEALGAAIYGLINDDNTNNVIKVNNTIPTRSFTTLPPIIDWIHKVTFKESSKRSAICDEECILGLDVGSTTTKAVLIATTDNAILANVYLYTNGNPIKAARQCYIQILKEINESVNIVGIGTTGSGRHIAGLHAQTQGIINEITAHSTAAVYYDSEVDTIFEIGGQDAKYSYITNKIPTDYAMNEACSAGTGSFIEEAAWESLGVKVAEIEILALKSEAPPNFSDQCAAFISSDIKTAQQEGVAKEDIIAGLAYSICYNYLNRVKGNRPIGKKIFMQGGVCYNKAIPIAMAGIADTDIIVPPAPGLMGAFGVALEIKEKQKLGLLEKGKYSLKALIERNVIYHKSFVCQGGSDKCDLKCSIAIIEIVGKKYPFGGSCEKYNSQPNTNTSINNTATNFVETRNKLLLSELQM